MHYSDEKQIQQLVSLLKQHGIRRVVASPGSSNVPLVASLQSDPCFDITSCVDERSAAYIACGMAAESGEPVVISCTGATASRNYLPGLTEAYYRKLPVLAVTASMNPDRIGHLYPQMMDRRSVQNDICVKSVQIKPVRVAEDRWANEVAINDAILALTRHGGGPAHINMVSDYGTSFESKELIETRKITRHFGTDERLPELPQRRIAVYVGSHLPWTRELVEAVDSFCRSHDAAVIVDHTSNYPGQCGVLTSIVSMQEQSQSPLLAMDLLVHIGEVSGSYYKLRPKEVWRVCPDGELRDFFGCLTRVFEMEEERFFNSYATGDERPCAYRQELQEARESALAKVSDLPFSNIWCASQAAPMVPKSSVMHFGILNSLRSWNLFELDPSIECYSNTGGFGIDGCVSSLVGGAIAQKDRLHFIVVGDLAFFYDLNVTGLRGFPPNARIMLVNNGVGSEFKVYNNIAAQFGQDADTFIAAKGHNGAQSASYVRDLAESLGFDYLSASTKSEFAEIAPRFFAEKGLERPVIMEVFTTDENESAALRIVSSAEVSLKGAMKSSVKSILGEKGKRTVKKLLRGE